MQFSSRVTLTTIVATHILVSTMSERKLLLSLLQKYCKNSFNIDHLSKTKVVTIKTL